MSPSITDLPTEVIQKILLKVPPNTIPTFQRLCKTRFRYWKPERHIKAKFASVIDETNWKELYIERYLIDRSTTRILNSILATQTGRIEKFQRILKHGYDVKDCLLQHLEVSSEAEDVLARRYYSDALLGCLQRTMAIREWSRLKNTKEVSLERALGGFDMFVLHDRKGDFDETKEYLDDVARSIRSEVSGFDGKCTREKAMLVAAHLRLRDCASSTVLNCSDNLQNNFIGISLNSPRQPFLPLVSTEIYCCVARRLAIDAAVCAFPFHALALITAPKGFDLDGNSTFHGHLELQEKDSAMYLDPYGSDSEIFVEDLIERLFLIGVPKSNHQLLLQASPVSEILLRTARNIFNSVQESHRTAMARRGHGNHGHVVSNPFPDLESSFYSALWASLLFGIPPDGDGSSITSRQRTYLPHIVEHFQSHFPTDVNLIEEYIVPLFQHTGEYAQLLESVRIMRSVDSMAKQIKRRSNHTTRHVHYRVGQVFVHRRYNYQGVITGWDAECGADEDWMAQMRVHELSRGRQQSFYHVLVEDKSVRYVAEENIELVHPETPQSLMDLAGRHFKRWDYESRCFISNIEDEYPQG